MSDEIIDRMHVYRTSTAFSHSLGNLTAIIEDYIKSQFNKDYFKKTYVTTEAGFKTISKFKNKEYMFERPMLVLDPKFLPDQESDALPRINWEKFNSVDSNNNTGLIMMNAEFFLKNTEKSFSLGYFFNRYKFNFGITMIVDTKMMSMSLNNYLRTTFRFKHPFPIPRYVETMIPRAYIDHMASKLDLSTSSEEFLSELNKYSQYPILRLFRPATGLIEFFTLVQEDIQLRITDYPSEDTIRVGRVDNYSQIKFDIEVELNLISSFLLAIPEVITVDNNDLTTEYTIKLAIDGRTPIPDNMLGNQLLYTKILFEADKETEVIELLNWLTDEITIVKEYVNANSINEQYITVKAYSFLNEIDLSISYNGSIDYTSLILTLNNLSKDVVYTILVYIDQNFVKNITATINDATLTHMPSEYIN